MLRLFGRVRAARARGDRGAVAVEAALVTPILLILVLGIIEFGFLFKDWLGVTSAVRAGARIGSALPRDASYAQAAADQVAKEGAALNLTASNSTLWVYKAGTNGYPVGYSDFSTCPTSSCTKFVWTGSAFQPSGGLGNIKWLASSQNACAGDPNHESLGVYLAVQDTGITRFFFTSKTLSSRTVMSLEPIPSTDVTKGGCKP
jgi:hypothetical protein